MSDPVVRSLIAALEARIVCLEGDVARLSEECEMARTATSALMAKVGAAGELMKADLPAVAR